MCLGCSWVLQEDKCQVSDNACSCLKHVETMTALSANGCDPWGKLKQMRLKSQMLSQMRQLQESARVIKSPRKSFMFVFFMMGHDWEVVLWYSYTVICVLVESQLAQLAELDIAAVSSIARNPLLKPLQKLKHQPRSKLRQMNCVLAVLEEKVV